VKEIGDAPEYKKTSITFALHPRLVLIISACNKLAWERLAPRQGLLGRREHADLWYENNSYLPYAVATLVTEYPALSSDLIIDPSRLFITLS
jgi:hypothetical protein